MTSVNSISGISSEQVKERLKQINGETPIIWTTSLLNSPQELTVRTVARNNIMLEKVLDNQNKIMEKMGIGDKLDVKV